jgi:hypothetical protein
MDVNALTLAARSTPAASLTANTIDTRCAVHIETVV